MEIMIDYLVIKLNEEMKNVVKNHLTKEVKDDIINISNEREETKND